MTTTYYLRSSALGGRVVAELSSSGARQKGYVWGGGELLAEQAGGNVVWRHEDPHGGSLVRWDKGLNFLGHEESDPSGVDVGASNPFAGGGGGDDSGVSGVSLVPDDPSGQCRHDGMPIHCARVGRMLAMGSAVLDTVTTVTIRWRSGKVESYSENAGLPEGYGAHFTGFAAGVAASAFGLYREEGFGRAVFMTVLWGRMAGGAQAEAGGGVAVAFFAPQNPASGFLIGRFGFSQQEMNRLAKAYERVASERCQKFFDDTLAGMRQRGEIANQSRFTPSTLRGVLNITTLNKYSPDLTARQVGVSEKSWANVQSKFANPEGTAYYSGVTLADGRVFLNDNAFYISGAVSGLIWNSTDLSGVITHEFFHRAGLNESQIRALHKDIQKNCGIPGYAL